MTRARVGRWVRACLAGSLCLVAACGDIATAPLPVVALHGSVTTPKGDPVPFATVIFRTPDAGLIALPARRRSEGGFGAAGGLSKAPMTARAENEEEPTSYAAKTDANGNFTLKLPATTFDVTIVPAYRSGLPTARLPRYPVERRDARLDYRYGGVEVKGAVVGPTGQSVLNAVVEFWNRDDYFIVVARVTSTGYVAYIPPGSYDIDISPPSSLMGLPSILRRSVPIDSDTVIDVPLTGHVVTGTVTGPEGETMAGASVFYEGDDVYSGALSDQQGRYELYAPGGSYMPYAYPPEIRRNVAPRDFPVVTVAGPTSADVPFDGFRWSGVVRNGAGGAPIPGAEVSIVDLIGFGQARSTCDAGGAFELFVEPGRSYAFYVYAPGFAGLDDRFINAIADSTFELTLSPSETP